MPARKKATAHQERARTMGKGASAKKRHHASSGESSDGGAPARNRLHAPKKRMRAPEIEDVEDDHTDSEIEEVPAENEEGEEEVHSGS